MQHYLSPLSLEWDQYFDKTVLKKTSNNKSVGIDNLPYEVLRSYESCLLLHHLFNKIFQSHIIPSIWRKAIIKPIPKNSTIDPRLPLQYRGIALLSTVYKIYSSVLNNRIVNYLESNNLYAEEQNGFRKNRSCSEHIFTVTTIIRNRISEGKPTYAAFLDAEKAFDRIDRNLLLYKLISLGITGHIYENIKAIYKEATCAINVNNMLTEWFETESGVKQGDTLSPTLFNIFINDLVPEINALGLGVQFDNRSISILLYADDIILLSETEEGLQKMLDCVYSWSKKNKIKFNASKSNIVHFRSKRQARTTFKFHLGNVVLNTVQQYKYLGIILNEYLDFSVTAQVLADSANRALGAIINKYKKINGLGYYTFTRLFHSGVCPILDYCTEIWGFKNFKSIEAVQNKAIRIFLGLHRFAPVAAINGDMGWTQCSVRQKVCLTRFWNRLVNLDMSRLPRQVLDYDRKCTGQTWSSNLKSALSSINQNNAYVTMSPISTQLAWSCFHENYCNEWNIEIQNKPKLRTYIKFKECYKVEDYVISFINRYQRSYLAQLRVGILPLHIETGRWYNVKEEDRTCKVCNNNQVESEMHFLFLCSKYDTPRNRLIEEVSKIMPNITNCNNEEKLKLFMTKGIVNIFSRYICEIYNIRKDTIFQTNV